MTNIINVSEILPQIPLILEYFIPGFIFMSIFQHMTSRSESSHQIIGSVAISYILKALCSLFHKVIFVKRSFEWSERVVILSLLALILSVLFVLLAELRVINKLVLRINNKSLHGDIWHDVIDYRNGTTLKLTCDDVTYFGVLAGHEEKGLDSWFVLDDYIVEDKGNDTVYASKDFTCKSRLAINLQTVKRLELYYGEPVPTLFDKIKETFSKIKEKYKLGNIN